MNTKHLTHERIVEISENREIATSLETLHLQSCLKCAKRLEIAGAIESALKKSGEVEPFLESSHIEEIAAGAFDSFLYLNEKNSYIKRIVIGFSAVAATILVVALPLIMGEKPVKEQGVEFAEKESETKLTEKEKLSEIKVETEFKRVAFDIAKNSVIKGEKYNIVAKEPSTMVHEHENYYSVKKGVVEFKVQSGNEFMVNLGNVALVRVLGTVFTVSVNKKKCSVQVTEGLVEVIDLGRGLSHSVGKGERNIIEKTKSERVKVAEERTEEREEKEKERVKPQEKISLKELFSDKESADMIYALIGDLETSLKFSDKPEIQLMELFPLYRKTGKWGSIIYQWNIKSDKIDTTSNKFLKEMHFAACEASIKLYLYDNGVCKRYKKRFPEGPDPVGMDDHLKMAW
ncbi:MAG: FecR domain-containing protein [bacterium]